MNVEQELSRLGFRSASDLDAEILRMQTEQREIRERVRKRQEKDAASGSVTQVGVTRIDPLHGQSLEDLLRLRQAIAAEMIHPARQELAPLDMGRVFILLVVVAGALFLIYYGFFR